MVDYPNIFGLGMDAFDQSYARTDRMRQDRARQQAGAAIAGGDYASGASTLNSAGMLDQAHNVLADQQVLEDRQLQSQQYKQKIAQQQKAQQIDGLLRLTDALQAVPQGQRQPWLQQQLPLIQQLGLPVQQFAGLDESHLTDQALLPWKAALGKAAEDYTLNGVRYQGGTNKPIAGVLQVKPDETVYAPGDAGPQDAPQAPAATTLPATPPQAAPGGSGAPYRDAISNIESKGNYSAIGPVTKSGDRAFGKYQVMGGNVGPWTQEVLGHALTPQQFLADPKAQDAVFDAKFGQFVQQYGSPEDAASVWFTGRPREQGANASDVNGVTGSQYVRQFAQTAPPAAQGANTVQGGVAADTPPPPPQIPGFHAIQAGQRKPQNPPTGYQWTPDGNLKPIPGGPADPGGLGAPGAQGGVHGADYLATLPPAQADQVKAIAEGRMQFPSGFALKTPYWQQMLAAVSQYDPNFDAVNYNARAKTRQDFTSGKNAQNIKALNTAIGHLGRLDSQISGTSGLGGFPGATMLNSAVNAYERSSGDPGVTNFEQTASALSTELTAVFRGTGGAEADVKRYLDQLNSNASDAQKKAAVRNIAELLRSRLDAIGDQYNQGMGTTADPLTLLNPKAQQTFSQLSGGAPPSRAPAATSAGWGKVVKH